MSGSVAVAGACGGCGASTLSAGIALAWACAGAQAVLAELDLERGDLAGAWGIPADRTLADLVAVAEELGPGHLDQVAHPHASGLMVLLAPGRADAAAPWRGAPAGRLAAALGARGPWVADAGPVLDGPAAGAAAAAGRVVVVAPPSVAGARRARALAARLAALGGPDPGLVISGAAGAGDLGDRALGRAAGLEVVARLPRDPRGAGELAAGRLPRRGPLVREVERLAEAWA